MRQRQCEERTEWVGHGNTLSGSGSLIAAVADGPSVGDDIGAADGSRLSGSEADAVGQITLASAVGSDRGSGDGSVARNSDVSRDVEQTRRNIVSHEHIECSVGLVATEIASGDEITLQEVLRANGETRDARGQTLGCDLGPLGVVNATVVGCVDRRDRGEEAEDVSGFRNASNDRRSRVSDIDAGSGLVGVATVIG